MNIKVAAFTVSEKSSNARAVLFVSSNKLWKDSSLLTESRGKQLRVRLGYEIHVELISNTTKFLGHTHTQRNNFYTEYHRDN